MLRGSLMCREPPYSQLMPGGKPSNDAIGITPLVMVYWTGRNHGNSYGQLPVSSGSVGT